MDIFFGSDDIQKLCSESRIMTKKLGAIGAKKLRARLEDLSTASVCADVRRGRPHPLKGDMLGFLALDLDGACRLVLEPADDPVPQHDEGGTDWGRVSSVRIIAIGDYHD